MHLGIDSLSPRLHSSFCQCLFCHSGSRLGCRSQGNSSFVPAIAIVILIAIDKVMVERDISGLINRLNLDAEDFGIVEKSPIVMDSRYIRS